MATKTKKPRGKSAAANDDTPQPEGGRVVELPLGGGKGVEVLSIPAIDKIANKYERLVEKRCAVSPGEVAAKRELLETLHAHRDQLPVNDMGQPFYRYEGRDYCVEEKLKRVQVDDGE